MVLLNIFEIALPLTNPILKFFLILLIILFAPILLNKIKIPHILGLIIAGAFIGQNGINLLERDGSIILSGTAGLLYIMFLAGLEIELAEFKKNSKHSIFFGMATFLIPMVLGILSGYYILGFSMPTTILLASMFASHTLISYPILSKLGVTKNRAVNITVGGTMITDTLALLVLAVIVGLSNGEVNTQFWLKLTLSILAFGVTVLLVFPIIGRWFLKHYEDKVSQYIFVLVMVFLGALLAETAGIEGIIGAFLSGLALNKLIPPSSALMNRIQFVGNAIFIPFFLISVGMLVDYRAFFGNWETIKVAVVMTIIATLAKFLAAWITQKTFKYSTDERHIIFGLSNAQAAATLAAVLVGYNIILGITPEGDPIRLLNDDILNGTIVMILVTCTIATFVTQKGAQNISLLESLAFDKSTSENEERILIPISNMKDIDELVTLGTIIKSKENTGSLFALNVINNHSEEAEKKAKKLLETAAISASSTDIQLQKLIRYNLSIANGVNSTCKEQNISDLILSWHRKKKATESFIGDLTEVLIAKCNTTILIYNSFQPISTVKRHLIVVPENAENEIGFPFWLMKIWNIALNSNAKMVFYGTDNTLNFIKDLNRKNPIDAFFQTFNNWDDFLILSREIKTDDNLIVVQSRKDKPSYHPNMSNIPAYLSNYFKSNSFILVYPIQGFADSEIFDFNNPSLAEPIGKLDEIGKALTRIFKRY